MIFNKIRKTMMASAVGVVTLVGTAVTVSAQNPTEEYREWQAAQRRAQEERQDWQRTRRASDYRDWQEAQRQAQREQMEYQRATRGNSYNVGYQNPAINRGRFYRINRDGRNYQTDYRGAELLRQAVNRGYQQGYNAGVRDRRYGRDDDYYRNDTMYRSGTFGYQSYVARDQYQHYFQRGFERGYEDGYNSTTRYGYRSGNTLNILGNVLNTILQVTDN